MYVDASEYLVYVCKGVYCRGLRRTGVHVGVYCIHIES